MSNKFFRWVRATAGIWMLALVVLVVFMLDGCVSAPVGESEIITLRTGQRCEVQGGKIIGCERNNRKYAETVGDIEAIVGEKQ